MENATVVQSLAEAEAVITGEVTKALDSIGTSKRNHERKSVNLGEKLAKIGITEPAMLESPYTRGPGHVFADDANATVTFHVNGKKRLWAEVYDAVFIAAAKGYCSQAEFEALTVADGAEGTDATKVTKTEVSRKMGSVMKDIRNSVKTHRRNAEIEILRVQMQDAEIERFQKEGGTLNSINTKDATREYNARGKDDPDPVNQMAGNLIVKAIEKLQKASPERLEQCPEGMDAVTAIASMRDALAALKVVDTTTEDGK